MAKDVENQLAAKLRKKKFTVQLDENTVNGSEAILLAYVRYFEDQQFKEEMLFCESLETTTTALDIYQTFKSFLDSHGIPMTSIVSCAADGACN